MKKKNCSKFEALKESLQFELPIRKLPFYLILHRNVNHTSTNIEKHSQILIMYFFLRCDTISEHLGMVFCDIGICMNVTKNHKTDYLK